MSRDNIDTALSAEQLKVLSKGFGDEEIIGILRRGQHSKLLLTLSTILDFAPDDQAGPAMELIETALITNESACLDALSYPHVAVWAWACLERLTGISDVGSQDDHLRYMACVAVAAASRAGVDDFEIAVPIRNSGVMLPGLGRATFTGMSPELEVKAVTATARMDNGVLTISYGDQLVVIPPDVTKPEAGWEPIRTIRAVCNGLNLTLMVDDLDPYREYLSIASVVPPSDRLDDVGFKAWNESIADAWEQLVRHHRAYAEGIAAGVQVLVPVHHESLHRHDRSPHAFGSIAITNSSPRWIAYALLEEFQRTKLTAIDYLHPIHNATHDELKFVTTWFPRPRSFRHLLEAFYALPAVAEFWDMQSRLTNDVTDAVRYSALSQIWMNRQTTLRNQLLSATELTDVGRSFVKAMPLVEPKETPELLVGLESGTQESAGSYEHDHRVLARLQNLRPTEDTLANLVDGWTRGIEPSADAPFALESFEGEILLGSRIRRDLFLTKVANPSLFQELKNDAAYLRALYPGVTAADVLLIDGRVDEARSSYLQLINQNPNGLEAWGGLVMSYRHSGDGDSDDGVHVGETLFRFPEVVAAVYGALRSLSAEVDPTRLAAWLSPILAQHDELAFSDAVTENSLGS